ncbi:hypothetical protein [Steroidobacter sp.]|uniref:hypothetical protein n=1 Tax=Steroidobacter sp. TaxID=1978227 RepID=UPI001A3B0047|nr:hypothetical protein [Steroidobacter sp.]MBL8268957.1 hypothetical protein [Steroidobacter sp.]
MQKASFIGVVAVLLIGAVGTVAWLLMAPEPEVRAVPRIVPRGALLDYAGKPLTTNETRWYLVLDLDAARRLDSQQTARLATDLARQLGMAPDLVKRIADRPRVRALHLPGRFSEQQAQRIREWLQGSEWHARRLIHFGHTPWRVYPQGSAMAPVLGIVNVDQYGIEGLELQQNKALIAGQTLRLSLEIDRQEAIATVLNEAMQRHQLIEASAVAVELATGRVAALVSLPSYDPADLPNRYGPNLRLKPVTQVFQPGPMLQPFLLHAVLSAASPRAKALKDAFAAGHRDVGAAMARELGYEGSKASLERSGLLDRVDLDFPGVAQTLIRRNGTPEILLRDMGNGAGVAPSLFTYSMSLATLLNGARQRTRLIGASLQAQPNASTSDNDAIYANILRTEMVRRVRQQSGNPQADFGGLWAVYRDRVEQGLGPQRAALALFAPAEQPRYLLTVMIRPSSSDLSADTVLGIGSAALESLLRPNPSSSI